MRLHDLVVTSRRVAETTRRLEKIRAIAELLGDLRGDEIAVAACYLSGSLPQGRIGLGSSAVHQVSATVGSREPGLTLGEVNRHFEQIAKTSGAGSGGAKASLLRHLMEKATTEEQDFLRRLILGELRQGALEGLVVEAVAKAAHVPVELVRRAHMLSGELGPVARAALEGGKGALARFGMALFRPVQPMLAQTAEDVSEALETLDEAAIEYKLDGARIQLHKSAGDVKVFTRALNEVSAAVPDVLEIARGVPAEELILDGEVLALRPDGRPLPFQTTMRRFGRRLDVETLRRELPLTPIFFDCLYRDGETLIDRPGRERFEALRESVHESSIVPRIVTASAEDASWFAERALNAGHEGVMAKALDAPYEAGRRGKSWLKIKRAHTLDLVVLAAEWGSGRRRGWLSNLHLGARDPAAGGYVMLGKTFKGMSDEMLAWQTRRLQELEISRDRWTVYVRPELVVEIAFNDLQASPHYPGGLALRFARVKRYRTDKRVEEADTIETVHALYAAQSEGGAEERRV